MTVKVNWKDKEHSGNCRYIVFDLRSKRRSENQIRGNQIYTQNTAA